MPRTNRCGTPSTPRSRPPGSARKSRRRGGSSDAVFLRRVYLDLVGVVPAYDETTAFLNDSDPHKRAKLIDKLLADPRHTPRSRPISGTWFSSAGIQNSFDVRSTIA